MVTNYTVDNLDKYVGQKVKDPYQRVIGSLASLYSDIDGNVKAVEVLFGDSYFKTVQADRVLIQKDEIVLLPDWKYSALRVIERLERARRRAKALDDLYAKGEIARSAYEEFKGQVSRDLDSLKKEANEAKEMIKKRIGELEDQIVEIEKAITALKMSYIAGEIGERGYKPAADILRQNKDRNLEEKNEAKRILDLIAKLETQNLDIDAVLKEISPSTTEGVQKGAEQPIVVELHEQPTAQSGTA
ncbi:MAG: CdvA-like protein [Fervidicoccaceae archaeon]